MGILHSKLGRANMPKRIATARIQTQNRLNLPPEVMDAIGAKQGDGVDFWQNGDGKIYIALPVPPTECSGAS